MFNPEANDTILKLVASHSDLHDAVEEEDRDEALRAVKIAALLSMRLVNLMPGGDKLGVRQMNADEMSQLKKDLNSLLS